VYPGATHTRFSHSLGVMHISGVFLRQILEPYLDDGVSRQDFLHYFFLLRLWGLTHDVGHGPFCHSFDDGVLEDFGMNHEYMSARIVKEDPEIGAIIERELSDFDVTPEVLSECLGKSREEWVTDRNIGETEHTETAFFQILKGFYSTDIIDYLLRDNLYTGAGYGNFDWQRLLLSSHLIENEIALDRKAKDTLDAFLLSRLFSFNTIYYHRWSRAVDHLVRKFLDRSKERINFREYLEDLGKYSELDEHSIFQLKELRGLPEAQMLLQRKIPYRRIGETVIGMPNSLSFLSENDISRSLLEKLGKKIPVDAYFVDTPNLSLNPMVGEADVSLVDYSTSPPITTREPIRRTSWGEIPHSVWTIRLYLDVRYNKHRQEVKRAFDAVFEGAGQRTHY